jgi:hypothetical protein
MIGRVTLSEDGFSIYGLEPPGLDRFPDDVRKMYWGWVLELALRAKDRDLARGLDKDGEPLKPISAATRKYRRSAMTASGKGDPSAPPLEPAWQKSRVRSLLTGREFRDHAEFWWGFDPYTRDSFARILEYQKKQGRDVFGLSQAAMTRVRAAAWQRFEKWRKGTYVEPAHEPLPSTILPVGATRGPLTYAERRRYVHGESPADLLGRPRRPMARSPVSGRWYSRLIRAMHEKPTWQPPQPQPPPAPMGPTPRFPKPGPLAGRRPVPVSVTPGFLSNVLAWLKRKIAG